MKSLFSLFPIVFVLAACAAPAPPQLGPDGRPLPQVYQISA